MSSFESLVMRIKAEYREMPGLQLTFPQACRLWQVQPAECQAVLRTLLDEGFLVHAPNETFAAATSTPRRPTHANAALRVHGTYRPA